MLKRLSACLALICLPLWVWAGDPIIDFGADDPAMQRAIAQARDTLPVFLNKATNAQGFGVAQASLKVKFVINDDLSEVIWVTSFRRTNSGFRGVLANEPVHMVGKRAGSRVTFGMDQIADWSLTANGRLYGNYTTRTMLTELDAASRKQMRQILSQRPMPSNW